MSMDGESRLQAIDSADEMSSSTRADIHDVP